MGDEKTWGDKWKSGFCCTGHCEGTKPKSPSGKPMKTCEYWDTCTCKCHAMLTQMFEMSGQPRQLVDNPEYLPEANPYVMPTAPIHDPSAVDARRTRVIVTESRAPGQVPPDMVVERTETATGRKGRGELEEEVKRVCDMWVLLKTNTPCTPVWVAEMIDAENPPSTGAITAVYERWVTVGFATMERKPTRFTGYTPEGVELGLYALKQRHKRRTG